MQKMIGFHQSHLDENIEKLVSLGHKVAIAEQTETSKQMAKRLLEQGDENDLKVVRREVAQIYSIGTFYKETSLQDYDTRYILAYCQDGETNFGFCYFDFSTLKFYLGSFEDDMTLKQFRTLGLQIRPVEVITSLASMSKARPSEFILKNTYSPPSFTYLSMNEINTDDKIKAKLQIYFGGDQKKWPESLAKLVKKDDDLAFQALGLAITYLERML